MIKAVVYSKPDCPYCEKVKQLFTQLDITHVMYTLDIDFTREQFFKEFGEGSTFPQVIIDGETVGGSVDTVRYLKENGYV